MTIIPENSCLNLLKNQLDELLKIYEKPVEYSCYEDSDIIAWVEVTALIISECFKDTDNVFEKKKSQPYFTKNDLIQFEGFLKSKIQIIEKRITAIQSNTHLNDLFISQSSEKIFIVHGQNEGITNEVVDFIRVLGYKPTIMKIESDRGDTLIEKLERLAREVGFVVVILTGDDYGCKKKEWNDEPLIKIFSRLKDVIPLRLQLGGFDGIEKEQSLKTLIRASEILELLKPRARQNVIFELGFFCGFLGRDRVCALYEEGTEWPSDFKGIGYKPLNEKGEWKEHLKTELDDWQIRLKESEIK